jgi:hypothetical protein
MSEWERYQIYRLNAGDNPMGYHEWLEYELIQARHDLRGYEAYISMMQYMACNGFEESVLKSLKNHQVDSEMERGA